MNLNITENLQHLRNEATLHWKTGAAVTVVAVVVNRVYGKAAAIGVVLLTISNYQIVGKQIRVLTWMSLRKSLIAVVLLGNSYFTIINPQLMSYLAVALMLIDNFQLSTLNDDLAAQNTKLDENNTALKAAYDSLKSFEDELLKLTGAAASLEEAKQAQDTSEKELEATVPEIIKQLPGRVSSLAALLKRVIDSKELQELARQKTLLKTQVQAILKEIGSITRDLQPITQQAKVVSASLRTTSCKLEANATLQSHQIDTLSGIAVRLQGVLA